MGVDSDGDNESNYIYCGICDNEVHKDDFEYCRICPYVIQLGSKYICNYCIYDLYDYNENEGQIKIVDGLIFCSSECLEVYNEEYKRENMDDK